MLTHPHHSAFYHGLSNLYDAVFSPFFQARAQATIRSLKIPPGAKVLELGVGTGLSLDAYPSHAQVVGVDLSEEMLAHARRKIAQRQWTHIELVRMNALELSFPDETFDYVMAFHLLTVVPDLPQLMRQIVRVCRPGGTVVLINHLRSERRWLAALVDCLSPITHLLGWHTKLGFAELERVAQPLVFLRRYKTSPYSLFTVMIARKPPLPEAQGRLGSPVAPPRAKARIDA
jgi:phosphatidylethanolamine/phosphatidyl-N-methylethanolamine N-methyltransferase